MGALPSGLELPPSAPLLMQSLRAVGYSTSSAIADIVDNSIAAGATTVSILVETQPKPAIAILDDGNGMTDAELVAAMRFGSRDPRDARNGLNLGRFGLGMKTASLSQCRRLTVISMTAAGELSAGQWDLDECERRGKWWLGRPRPNDMDRAAVERLRTQGKGTAVIWSDLDRITSSAGVDRARSMQTAIIDAADHLAMVFHRFISGELVPGFRLLLNERPLPKLDPFLQGHSRGQALHAETFTIDGEKVVVSPFVLPFPSRLAQTDLDAAGGREGLKTGHGFYVYRGGRLVVPGGWFRIVPSDELIRLARVRVDVPVALDHLWKVDIRKTVAEPPIALRPHLRRIVGDVTMRSKRVYTHRGNVALDTNRVPLWQRREMRDGAASWQVNRDHPAVKVLSGSDEDMQTLLRLLEDSLPIHDIHLHISNDLPVADAPIQLEADLRQLAQRMFEAFAGKPELARDLMDRLPQIDPFSRDPALARRISGELSA